MGAFAETVKNVEELNARNGEEDSVFGVSHFADLFDHELLAATPKGLVLGDTREFERLDTSFASRLSSSLIGAAQDLQQPVLPQVMDWRRTNAITPIKSQGACGDCWAFSVAEEVESMYVIHVDDHAQQTFSPQQITSCTPKSMGCGGGSPINGFMYLQTVGLAQEVFWPFAGGLTPQSVCQGPECTESCDKDLADIYKYQGLIGPYASVKSAYYAVTPCQDKGCKNQDLDSLAWAVAGIGPLSVAVNAKVWKNYRGGVLSFEGCGDTDMKDLDHAVQLVGFNQKAEKPYWIVRNTWSTNWGHNGYIYLEYGKNTCGIANLATYPELHTREEANGHSPRRLQDSKGERFARLYRQATNEEAEFV